MCELTDKLRSYDKTSGYSTTMRKAADEIDRLRAEIEYLDQKIDSALIANETNVPYVQFLLHEAKNRTHNESHDNERRRVEQLVMRLRQYNDWRRGDDSNMPQLLTVGKDIDDAIATIEKYIKLLDK